MRLLAVPDVPATSEADVGLSSRVGGGSDQQTLQGPTKRFAILYETAKKPLVTYPFAFAVARPSTSGRQDVV